MPHMFTWAHMRAVMSLCLSLSFLFPFTHTFNPKQFSCIIVRPSWWGMHSWETAIHGAESLSLLSALSGAGPSKCVLLAARLCGPHKKGLCGMTSERLPFTRPRHSYWHAHPLFPAFLAPANPHCSSSSLGGFSSLISCFTVSVQICAQTWDGGIISQAHDVSLFNKLKQSTIIYSWKKR